MAQINPYFSSAILHKMRVYYTALTGLSGATSDVPGVANTNFSNQHCVIVDSLTPGGKANILVNVNASDLAMLPDEEHITMLFGAFGQAVANQIFTSSSVFRANLEAVPEESRGVYTQILMLLDEGYAQSHIDEVIGGPLLSAEYQYVNYIYTYGLSLTDYAEDKNQFYEALRQYGLEGRLNSDFSNPLMQRFFIEKAPVISEAMYIQNQTQRAKTAVDLANELRERFGITEPLLNGPKPTPGIEMTGSTKNKGITVTNRQAVLEQLEEAKKAMEEGRINPEDMKPGEGDLGNQLISHDKEVNEKMKELGMATSEVPEGAENSGVTIMEDDRQDDFGIDEEIDGVSDEAGFDPETSEMLPETGAREEDSELEVVGADGKPTGSKKAEGPSKLESPTDALSNSTEEPQTGAEQAGTETTVDDASSTHGEHGGTDGQVNASAQSAAFSNSDDKDFSSNFESAEFKHDSDMSGENVDLSGAGANVMPTSVTEGELPSLSGMADDLMLSKYDVNDEMLSLTESLITEISEDARSAAEEAAMSAQEAADARDNFENLTCTDLHGLSTEYSEWLSTGNDPVSNNVVLDFIKGTRAFTSLDVNSFDPADPSGSLTHGRMDKGTLSEQYDIMVAKLTPQIKYLTTALEKMLIKERNAHNYGKKGKLSLKKQFNKPQSLRPFIKHNNIDNAYNTCVTCLVDLSGSMCGDKSFQAMIGAIILSETCSKLGVPCKIAGFHSPKSYSDSPAHEFFTSWANSRPERETLMAIPALTTGNNYDAFAITFLAEDALKTAPADHNLIFVLSDGYPQTRERTPYSRSEEISCGEKEVRRIVRALKRKARVYGIGINHNVSNIYENTTINIKDASQIGVTLGAYLQVALRDFVREDLS